MQILYALTKIKPNERLNVLGNFDVPLTFFVLIGDLYSTEDVRDEVMLGNRMSRCEPFAVTILLFMAYSLVVMSLAMSVVRTVAMYVSFTKRYSRADLCQYKYLHVLAATIDTCHKTKYTTI